MNEQQEMSEREINLVDLMFYCLERWRWILVSMLVIGILAGGYKYQATVRDNQSKQKEAASEKEGGKKEEKDINEQSIESYKQALEECEYDMEAQKDYLNNSAVMQIDPYHVSMGILSYYVNGGEHLDSLVAAYRAFVTDGRMAEQLHEKDKEVSVSDLRYLVSFISGERDAYRLGDNQVIRPEELVFQIRIEMSDEKLCKKYLETAEEVLEAYGSQLQRSVAEHSLQKLASVQSEMMDSELKSYQTTAWNTYVETLRKIQALQTEMKEVVSLEGDGADGTAEASPAALANPFSSALKYAIVGIVLGAFMMCFVIVFLYIMGGRLQDTREFSKEFGMPMLGLVKDSGAKKRLFGFIDAWIFRLEEGAYAGLGFEEQARLAAANIQAAVSKRLGGRDTKKIMLAGTVAEKEVTALCERLTADMKGISWSAYTQIVFQAEALEDLKNYDGILFVEKRGVSDLRFIVKERRLALDRDVEVLGTVVVC